MDSRFHGNDEEIDFGSDPIICLITPDSNQEAKLPTGNKCVVLAGKIPFLTGQNR